MFGILTKRAKCVAETSSRVRIALLSLVAALLLAAPAREAGAADPSQTVQIAGLNVALWLPGGAGGGAQPRPLVLFSHAYEGCKTQSGYLMRALADHGMVVAAPDHRDARSPCAIASRPPASLDTLPSSLTNDANWNPSLYQDRRDDLRRLRAAIEQGGTPAGQVDPARVVLIGHSLGGYTVLGLAGGWPSWRGSDRIAAVVALAPFVQPFLMGGGMLGAISVPVLVQGGTSDEAIPASMLEGEAYRALRSASPACLVMYQGANHFAWTSLDAKLHQATAAAAVAFLEDVFAARRPSDASLASRDAQQPVCR
ncbi:alpha/beta hydrolase family protein [Falsiroseomonas sp. E2-1-a4]|uniref:alpha/beta hydrolase family protein n=1 Tax=Falsiroseomonas sp. E2-1-a4 TaxID=3239299 RepID=UPI003F2EF330